MIELFEIRIVGASIVRNEKALCCKSGRPTVAPTGICLKLPDEIGICKFGACMV